MQPTNLEAAELELRAALDSDDSERIARASAEVERLDQLERQRPASPPRLVGSALWYAGRGVPVFRLMPGRKRPLPGSRGLKEATTDLERIRAWWADLPAANIGLATGYAFDAVDIDGPPGQLSRVRHWCDADACLDPSCQHPGTFAQIERDQLAKVLTPRPGGMHIYVPPTGDGNKAGILPGVDYRGLGGYVVAPPSILGKLEDHPGPYRFLGEPRGLAELVANRSGA